MITDGGSAADVAITSPERRFLISVQADWGRDGSYGHVMSDLTPYVSEVIVDRQLNGSLPGELSVTTGTAAAELTLVLSGEDSAGRNIVSLFSPYQVNSPFWASDLVGAEIKFSIAVEISTGIWWYPQFVGNVRTITPDRGESTVEITALDRVEKLRGPIRFAPWAVSEQQASVGLLQAQLMESHWVIDHCLRMSDCSTSPYRPITPEEIGLEDTWSGPALYLTGNGGVVPTIGWMDNPTFQEFPSQENGSPMYEAIGDTHPNAPDATKKPLVFRAVAGDTNSDSLLYWVSDRNQINSRASHVMGFTLIQQGSNGTYWQTIPDTKVFSVELRDNVEMSIWLNAGKVRSEWTRAGSSPLSLSSPEVTIPAGTSCRVFAAWDAFNTNGPMVYVQAGANNSGVVDLGAPISFVSSDATLAGLAHVNHVVSMQDIHVTVTNWGGIGTGTQFLPPAAKYAASLDRGLNRLSFLPVRDREDAWEVIKEVVDAEAGAAFWDEQGRFLFWSLDTIESKRTSIARELSLDDVTGLNITSSLDSVRNMYSMGKAKARTVNFTNIYVSDDVDEFYVPGRTSKRFQIYLDNVVSPEPGYLDRYRTIPTGGQQVWDDDTRHGYVVQFLLDGVWREDSASISGIDIQCYYDRDGHVIVDIWNGYTVPVRLASGDGTTDPRPAFHLMGSQRVEYGRATSLTKDQASIDKFGPRNLKLDGDWYQDESDANSLTSKLLAKTTTPSPVTDNIEIAGDPRLQLCDTLRVRDPNGFGEYFDVQIYGIRRRFSVEDGLTDTFSVELLPPAGIWDDTYYGIWEDTFVWG